MAGMAGCSRTSLYLDGIKVDLRTRAVWVPTAAGGYRRAMTWKDLPAAGAVVVTPRGSRPDARPPEQWPAGWVTIAADRAAGRGRRGRHQRRSLAELAPDPDRLALAAAVGPAHARLVLAPRLDSIGAVLDEQLDQELAGAHLAHLLARTDAAGRAAALEALALYGRVPGGVVRPYLTTDLSETAAIGFATNPYLRFEDLVPLLDHPSQTVAYILLDRRDTPTDVLRAHASGVLDDVVAAHPSTPGDVLARLADRHPRLVAANPSARADTLTELARIAPEQVAANPSAPAALLSELAARWPWETAANPATPAATLRSLAHDALTHDPSAISRLQYGERSTRTLDPTVTLLAEIFANPSCPPDLRADGAEPYRTLAVRMAVVRSPFAEPAVLDKLFWETNGDGTVIGPDWDVALAVLDHPNCPPEIIEYLSRDEDIDVAAEAIDRMSDPVMLREVLADNATPEGRARALSNPNCPADELHAAAARLSQQGDDAYLEFTAVVSNPSTPPETLALLVGSSAENDRFLYGFAPERLTDDALRAATAAAPVADLDRRLVARLLDASGLPARRLDLACALAADFVGTVDELIAVTEALG